MDAHRPLRRLFREDGDHLGKGVIDVIADDQAAVHRRSVGEVGADEHHARFGTFELVLVFLVADEGELIALRIPDSGDAGDGAVGRTDQFAVDHFSDFRGGECDVIHEVRSFLKLFSS